MEAEAVPAAVVLAEVAVAVAVAAEALVVVAVEEASVEATAAVEVSVAVAAITVDHAYTEALVEAYLVHDTEDVAAAFTPVVVAAVVD